MLHAALILEGGSLRGLFTCGVLDVLMENDLWFEYVNGVSAGALNAYSYISRQIGRSSQIPFEYVHDKRYTGLRNLIFHGGIFNFDFMFGELSDTLVPLDKAVFEASEQIFECVATQLESGRAAFFRKDACSPAEFELASRASASMPLLSKKIKICGKHYLDGGVALPIAHARAMELGYDKPVLVLTRQQGYRKPPESSKFAKMCDFAYARYPEFLKTLHRVPAHYNEIQEELEALEAAGKVFIIRPEEPVAVGRLEKDVEKLRALYRCGRSVAEKRLDALRAYLGK